jgi:hypothetical protein
MKNRFSVVTGLSCLFLFLALFSNAQEKVTEKKLLGTWLLVIDIEEEMDIAAEEEENPFARAVIRGVSGLVDGLMENIEIYFDFMPDGEARILVDAFGEEEIEYAQWEINSRGELMIISDADNVQINDDDFWMMDGKNTLISFDDDSGEIEENVYMRRIE